MILSLRSFDNGAGIFSLSSSIPLYYVPYFSNLLEQINLMMPLYSYRHCEERSDVAIYAAVQLPETLKQAEMVSGLPRRFASRNDECHTLCAFVY
jgi:hypothetical protein